MAANWLDQLNPAQREAVTHGDGPLLVVAGAGTGKTKTLACRVAYLLDKGVSPDRLLLLTFTRRAAAEMVRRAGQLSQHSAAGSVWGGTFHAVANRLLRIYGQAVGLRADFTVMDQGDAADLMNLIRSERGLGTRDRRFPKKHTLVNIYSRAVNAQEKLARTIERYFPWCAAELEDIGGVFEAYTTRKREQNVLDYDDLLLMWRALCASPQAGASVADRFEHVLVDEYQDTNAVQADILRGMRRKHANIMAVGDDAQSIYSFRAATIRNILDFPEQFAGTRVVTLEQNYRSTRPILAASNAVMEQAAERYTKELWSDRASGGPPVLLTCMDEQQQCEAVCERVLAHLEEGIPLMRQAVLFRAGHHSDMLEVELSRRNIPFHKYGGLKFIEAAHIKDMLAFLRILENPTDELSWFRLLLLLDGIGPKTAQRIMRDLGVRQQPPTPAGENGGRTIALKSALRRFIEKAPRVPAAAREQIAQLRETLATCSGRKVDSADDADDAPTAVPLASQIERIRAFYEPVFERLYDNATMRLRDIEQLEAIAAGYRSRGRFVTDLTLDPPTSTSDLAGPPQLDEDYLILSTIHSAKGCEWDVVNIIHAADGMIPSDMAVGDEAGVDEERRLFYVAMTRAKDHLHVYFPLRYYHTKHRMGDAHSYAQLTRFISPSALRLFDQQSAATEIDDDPPTDPSNVQQVDRWVNRLWGEE